MSAPSFEPPKPRPRPARVRWWQYVRLFRQDILSSQPEHLFGAWMAEYRTPFFRSYLVNQPDLIDEVLKARPIDFPKSDRVGEGLRPLLGQSVFLTNGPVWERQRRIIDLAFEGGRLRESVPHMIAAGAAEVARLQAENLDQPIEIEEVCSRIAADVIFRALFSKPIDSQVAADVFQAFKAHQRTQPILNAAAFLPLPRWMPRGHRRRTRATSAVIRRLITDLTEARQREIDAGEAPDDLATKLMTIEDPVTGTRLSTEDMVDQVAIFFLAGHETSASALAWTLYLLASAPDWQEAVAEEAQALPADIKFPDLARLPITRDVFREALRLYPPVPMMVREATQDEPFRNRVLRRGSQIVLSPWHLHRHTRLWDAPDAFDPARWQSAAGKQSQREAYMPFSAGPRVCPGAGFAMAEGVLLLALLLRRFRVAPVPGRAPVPVAHLTVRAKDGIWVHLTPRA